MQVTGYMLREAIRRWQLRRDTLATQFEDTLHTFEDDSKQSPDEVASAFMKAEKAIAMLQAAQAEYNLNVSIESKMVEPMSLCMAVKLIGGAGRMEKSWRTAAAPQKDRYGYERNLVRNKDEVRAKVTLSAKELTDRATKAANYAGALRAGIAEANSVKKELPGLDAALFE